VKVIRHAKTRRRGSIALRFYGRIMACTSTALGTSLAFATFLAWSISVPFSPLALSSLALLFTTLARVAQHAVLG